MGLNNWTIRTMKQNLNYREKEKIKRKQNKKTNKQTKLHNHYQSCETKSTPSPVSQQDTDYLQKLVSGQWGRIFTITIIRTKGQNLRIFTITIIRTKGQNLRIFTITTIRTKGQNLNYLWCQDNEAEQSPSLVSGPQCRVYTISRMRQNISYH